MKALAGGWTLTGVGVLLGVGSSLALAAAGPDLIDPARSCRYRFDEAHEFKARVQHFPPRVTCVRDDGQTVEYLSSGTTLVGTVLLAAAVLLLLAGLVLLAVPWLRGDTATGPRPAGSRRMHLWLSLLLGITVTVAVSAVGILVYVFLGLLTAMFSVVPALLGATVLAALFDRVAGPGTPGHRRRGLAVAVGGGLIGYAVLEVGLLTDVLPLGDWGLLAVPLSAVPCAAIVAVQHALAPKPAPPVPVG
ncbi:hypothetical protein Daura_12550 [Dactylosporangium aurantiacum]|uniref:Uncharacterized protein n=1 Tax=Dactylosporangium aurantiacum TaxID=35754 RepID=A0A9Q9IIS9_9ACTN|nr:hypothetical protein [Dactylosporangium aurantiacum]MDG6104054.1 hypothetical protein [Dactylosporangium aurantiacum]UWZ56924.1 hypothetical protein Daura_12550 [Dactylosporangium aurantiacum]